MGKINKPVAIFDVPDVASFCPRSTQYPRASIQLLDVGMTVYLDDTPHAIDSVTTKSI
jgi:hypothetical protein